MLSKSLQAVTKRTLVLWKSSSSTTMNPAEIQLQYLRPIFNNYKERPYNQKLNPLTQSGLSDHLKDKLSGSLVGLAVGDAVGAYFEFKSAEYVRKNPPIDMRSGGTWGLDAGQWTDDTSMALCLAASLLMTGECDPYDQLMRYQAWHQKSYLSSKPGDGPAFDIGIGTRTTLGTFLNWQNDVLSRKGLAQSDTDGKFQIEGVVYDTMKEEYVSAEPKPVFAHPATGGNGSLMRLAPIPIFYHSDTNFAIQHAQTSSETTHRAQFAIDACKLYTALICEAFKPGASKSALLHADFRKQFPGLNKLDNGITAIAEGSYKTPADSPPRDIIGDNGAASTSLKAALWAVYNDGDDFRKGVELAVGLGGDTDTVAAIYGQLAGALYGYGKIPGSWKKKLFKQEFIQDLALYLAERGC